MNIARHAALIGLAAAGVLIALAWSFLWLPDDGAAKESGSTPNAIDIGFAQAMSQHHDQAVLMSQILLGGEASGLNAVALSVQTEQLVQIGQMRGWLQLWEAPSLPASRTMDWMLTAPAPPDPDLLSYLAACQSEQGMPGMASAAELQQLREARGSDRERLFLQLMIRHHTGALPMARFTAQHAAVPAVRALAAQVAYEQLQETQRLAQLLQQRGGQPSPESSLLRLGK